MSGIDEVRDRALALILPRADHGHRTIVALAGPPGAGKSTLAAALATALARAGVAAANVPMDGFHLDNAVLDERGLRARKGAPETFDAAGFLTLVNRLRTGEEVVVPVFDRARDIAIAGAQVVPRDTRVVICEGNYLLFDEEPWSALAPLWDIAVRLDPPMPVLQARLVGRWLQHGLDRAAAEARAMGNDIPNAERVRARALPADLVVGD